MQVTKILSDKAMARLRQGDVNKLVVALSGGADSVALLHMLVNAGLEKPVEALHINHGLMKEADQWQAFCEHYCQDLGVLLTCVCVEVAKNGSLEANARQARYQVFKDILRQGDILVMAHHGDDQLETVLLKLFRGSEAFGVRGMPEERQVGEATLYRPLLDSRRQDILDYCRSNGLSWEEDASNQSLAMDRNYLRHELLPQIEKRFPASRKALLDAVVRDEKMTGIIDQLAARDHDICKTADGGIQLGKLAHIGEARQAGLLRSFLQSRGAPLPTGKQIRECLRVMQQASEDAGPLIQWSGYQIRLHRKNLYLLRATEITPLLEAVDWCIEKPLKIANGILTARVTEARFEAQPTGLVVDVRFRTGGEKIKLHRTRTLKNLFQENGLPVWLRSSLPLIYYEDQLVAMPAVPVWRVPAVQVSGIEALDGLTFQFDINDRL